MFEFPPDGPGYRGLKVPRGSWISTGTAVLGPTGNAGAPHLSAPADAPGSGVLSRSVPGRPRLLEHALIDAIGSRSPGRARGLVKDVREFSTVTDGAAYTGRPEMSSEFEFLVEAAQAAPSPPRPGLPNEPAAALARIVGSLSAAGMQAIAVDRTSRELADVGLTATTVVVPKLMPMTLLPLAQYRAHPRLYEGPERMGHRSFTEEELNPWPQPFA